MTLQHYLDTIEKEFDETLSNVIGTTTLDSVRIKSFLSSSLTRTLTEVLKEVVGEEKECDCESPTGEIFPCQEGEGYMDGYNERRSSIISRAKKLGITIEE